MIYDNDRYMKNNKNVPNNIGQRMVNSVVLQTLTPLSASHNIYIGKKLYVMT